jgi:hypothetical protein
MLQRPPPLLSSFVLPFTIPMPIPNATEATAATEKVRDYLLNPEHPDGGSKATWFQSLGYARDRWHELASDLLALAATCEQFATVRTPFGVKYVVKGQIGRGPHRAASVLAVWIVEADRPPRLVTASEPGAGSAGGLGPAERLALRSRAADRNRSATRGEADA